MRKINLIIGGILLGLSQISMATTLVCKNNFREYSVEYNNNKRTLILNGSTQYTVLAVEKAKDKDVVVGSTVNGGPTFRLILPKSQKPAFEFYEDNKKFQTDLCRYIKK